MTDMQRCATCGRQSPPTGSFCPSCGNRAGETSDQMSWDVNVSILSNTTVLKQLVIVFGLSIFLLVLFMFFLGLVDGDMDIEYLAFLGKLFIFMFLGFCIMTAIGVLIFMGNRYGYTFTINSRGIAEATQSRQYRRNTFFNALLGILAIFSRNPTAMGTAVLAQSRQKQFVNWKDINRVEADPRRKQIILKKNYRTKMAVFCNAENFETVYLTILKYTGGDGMS